MQLNFSCYCLIKCLFSNLEINLSLSCFLFILLHICILTIIFNIADDFDMIFEVEFIILLILMYKLSSCFSNFHYFILTEPFLLGVLASPDASFVALFAVPSSMKVWHFGQIVKIILPHTYTVFTWNRQLGWYIRYHILERKLDTQH